MVKSILIFINLGGLMIFSFFFLQTIEVQNNLPAQLLPGETTEVELTIIKGNVTGFAKLQLNLDPGLSIENIESQGASFTFSDQKAKFIWMSLPEEKSITIRYRLLAATNATGPKKIDGHFSYIDDNQRLVHDLSPDYVQTAGKAVVEDASTPVGNNQNTTASVVRTIEPIERGRFRVTLTISKNQLEGFAKIQETISPDFTAASHETNDAVFNIVDQKVKFVWFDIPSPSEISVSYDLIPVTDNPSPEPKPEGEFSFLIDNETRTVVIQGSASPQVAELPVEENEELAEEEVIEETSPKTEEEEIVVVEETEEWDNRNLNEVSEPTEHAVTEEEIEPEPIVEEIEVEEPEPAPAPVTASTMPETDISYRVQISAARKLVDENYFKKTHNFQGKYIVENHNGWVKYTTGGFDIYRSARDHRNELSTYKFPGPFVTAYNDGERITVQEALMITNQKWLP